MKQRNDRPVSPKGAPGTPDCGTPKREWTNLDVEAERAQLQELLARAAAAGDEGEIARLSARLRLLD